MRLDQVASTIRRGIGAVLLRGLGDERIRGLVSVTRVAVAPDLRTATVHVSVLPQEHAALTLHGLNRAAPRIQAELARHVQLRRTPRLKFELDDSLKKQAALDAALAEARAAGDGPAGSGPEPGEPQEPAP